MRRALSILLAAAGYYFVIPFVINFLPINTGVNVGFSIGAAALFIAGWFLAGIFVVAALIGFGKVALREKALQSKCRFLVRTQNAPITINQRDVRSDAVFIGLIGIYSLYRVFAMLVKCIGSSERITSHGAAGVMFLIALSAPFAVIGIMLTKIAVKGYKAWPTTKQLLAEMDKVHCRECGYSLIGLSEKRCPECGTSFEHSPPETPMNLTENQGA